MIDDTAAVLYKWNGRKIDAGKFNPGIMRAIVQKVGDVFLDGFKFAGLRTSRAVRVNCVEINRTEVSFYLALMSKR